MRIIDRYIAREVFSHALIGLGVFTFVLFVPQLVRLMELIVRHSAGLGTVILLFVSTLPAVFTFTIPMAVLLGVLIGLGRMSADSEVIALHALGIGLRRVLVPVGVLALATACITGVMTFLLGPAALRTFRSIEDRLRATQASFQVQPRVFDERFPRLVLYVHDVEAAATHWRGIFLAESDTGNGARVTLAEGAIVIADREQGKLQLHLQNGSTHEYSRAQPDHYSVSTFGESDLPVSISADSPEHVRQATPGERGALDLLFTTGAGAREARVEFHRRLAMPAACVVFALIAVPIGARPRRGGRAGAFVVTLLLLCGYYFIFIAGAQMARQGRISPLLGMWAANLLTALLGLFLLPRMEQIRGSGLFSHVLSVVMPSRLIHHAAPPAAASSSHAATVVPFPTPTVTSAASRLARSARRDGVLPFGFPLLIDLYILRKFTFFFALILAGFLLLFDSFTFFELLDDIARNSIPYVVVANYFRYLAPHMLYQLAPLAALVAVLVTIGILTKRNEIIAFQAGGISLYRLTLPLLVTGLALSAVLLTLDDSYLPFANQQQDALRNRIKGRPAQTFYQPRRSWIFGQGGKLYNYEFFDPVQNVFGGLSVFTLDQNTFQLLRRVYATRAHWSPHQKMWILEQGWVRDFDGGTVKNYLPFSARTLSEINEPPAYFNREVRQYYQMNWRELRAYINELQQAGFDTARLSVQWHKKFAFPLMAPVIILLGVPFAILVGTRGAVGGIAMAVAIGIVYWSTSALFEALGAVGQLPPSLAAWAPDAIFAFAGLYFFLKMPT